MIIVEGLVWMIFRIELIAIEHTRSLVREDTRYNIRRASSWLVLILGRLDQLLGRSVHSLCLIVQ